MGVEPATPGSSAIPTSDELVARAAAMVADVRSRAAEAEELGRLPDSTVAEMKAAGFGRTLRPAFYGGFEKDYRTFGRIVREMGRGCASSGWCAGTWMSQAMTLARYPKQAQDEICGDDPDVFIGSTAVPGGMAVPVKGGWMVNGRWSFASGIHHAGWMSVGVMMPEGPIRGMMLPTNEVDILDTWNVMGLRGTGSTDFVAKDLFVPEHRSIDGASWVWKPAREPFVTGPLRNHGAGTTQVSSSIFAPSAVGNAEGFIDAFVEGAGNRTITYARTKQSEHVGTQQRLAESAIEVDTAWMLLQRCYDVLDEYADSGRIPTETRSRMRRDTAFAVNVCYRAINRIFEVSGAHALQTSGELQRRWRDAHAIASQPNFHFDFEAETWGRLKLGLEHQHPSL
ncbi:MAG: acyl-CoA dehydrogenase family protein [Dehalococcoidia bacterium]